MTAQVDRLFIDGKVFGIDSGELTLPWNGYNLVITTTKLRVYDKCYFCKEMFMGDALVITYLDVKLPGFDSGPFLSHPDCLHLLTAVEDK